MTQTISETDTQGALSGLVVVELSDERTAFAGKLLADLGADVIVVEPPGGSPARAQAPFVDGHQDREHSLWWWHYNTSKRSIVIDAKSAAGAAELHRLVLSADIVLDGRPFVEGDQAAIDRDEVRAEAPGLIWTHITPYGASVSEQLDTDLTLLAEGGPVWNNGYDDHTLPPVRGGGGQAAHMAGTFAAISILAAVLRRDITGNGQVVDVSMLAAANMTTESATFNYFVQGTTVRRQTGRHAAVQPTLEVQVLAADGRYVTTGFLPTSKENLGKLLDWLTELGALDDFPERVFLQLGFDQGGVDRSQFDDPEAMLIMTAAREALQLIASRSSAYDFFLGSQVRGFQCGILYSPEEAFEDVHFKARGFQQTLHQPSIDRDVRYPGAPYQFSDTPWRLSGPAPTIDQHGDEIRATLLAPEASTNG